LGRLRTWSVGAENRPSLQSRKLLSISPKRSST